jgi:transketolase
MRTAFIETLCELATADPRIWLLTGDLGFSVLEVFAGRFPDRYVNVGVAEQNMTGVAAGLAMSGKVVFTYSIANFPTLRCLEQIRNDVCYHEANVKVVAVGGGLSYGNLGYTHHGIEDLAIMRVLPGMVVAAPGDPAETRAVTRMIAARDGPAYLRLGKAGEPVVHELAVDLEHGQALVVRDGKDLAIVSTGATLKLAVTAADLLGREGIAATVISVPVLKPLDAQTILSAAQRTGRVVTVEEHKQGGLGSIVAELIATQAHGCRLGIVCLPDEIFHAAGSQDHLRGLGGVTVENLREKAHQVLRD